MEKRKGGEKWNKEKEKREEMEGKEKWLIEEGLWPHCSSFFLTSCSQSVGQIPLLEHRKPHKHVCAHTPFFPYTLKPSITNTHPHKTHTFCQSHTPHTLLIKRTHSAHSHARRHTHAHTESNYSSQEEKRTPRPWPFYRTVEGVRKRGLFIALLPPLLLFNIFFSISPILSHIHVFKGQVRGETVPSSKREDFIPSENKESTIPLLCKRSVCWVFFCCFLH